MSLLGHIVERCGGSCAPIYQALKVPLRRGSRVALLSDLPSLLFPRRQVGLSRFLRLTFTAGCDPVFWRFRQGSNLRPRLYYIILIICQVFLKIIIVFLNTI